VHRPLRWGIAGTGLIAEDMTSVASMLPGVVLQAVAARKSVDKAKAFADKHGARAFAGTKRLLKALSFV
jgi:predicted dehydrogenase